jgi:hypothetical protein
VLDALGPLLDVPGVFVLGSNDYYAPTLRNPLRTCSRRRRAHHTTQAAVARPRDAFARRGWTDLTNRRTSATVAT